MSNKKTGAKFERDFLKYLADNEWWAHFLSPDKSGAQPFDIIAMRGSDVMAIDCKTCSADRFPLSRVEENQYWAFRSIMWKADTFCGFAILHNEEIYLIPFDVILAVKKKNESSILLKEEYKQYASDRIERHKD